MIREVLFVLFLSRGANSSHWWFRWLVWWCLAAAPKRFPKRSIFPNEKSEKSIRPAHSETFILLEPLFLAKKACDARISITSCPFKQFLTMRGWRAMRGMAMLCFPVDLTSWFHSRSWVNSMVNWLLVQKCLFLVIFFWSGENWKVVTGGFGWRPKWLK